MALTVASGVLQGRIRNRWGPSETMQAAAQELGKVPNSFGGPQNDRWQLKTTETTDKLPDNVVEMLECTGYINRCYENRRTDANGQRFCGDRPYQARSPRIRPRFAFHRKITPAATRAQPVVIPTAAEQDDELWALSFKTKNVREDLLRVYYGWTTSGRWSATDNPRYAFVGSPYLYKIQVESQMPAGSNLKSTDTCREFLKDFLPV